jgi:hypothetical protein
MRNTFFFFLLLYPYLALAQPSAPNQGGSKASSIKLDGSAPVQAGLNPFSWVYRNTPNLPSWVGVAGNAAGPGSEGLTNSMGMLRTDGIKGKGMISGSGNWQSKVAMYGSLGERMRKVGAVTNIFIDTLGNVSSIAGAASGGDIVGVSQETQNAVFSGACASAGAAAGGKSCFVLGGVVGGPVGAMVGGALGTAGGALAGSYFYDQYGKPQIESRADKEFEASLDSVAESEELDPERISARLVALLRDAQAALTAHKLNVAYDKAQKALKHLDEMKGILNGAGKSDDVAKFNAKGMQISQAASRAKAAVAKAEEALENAKTLSSATLKNELFKSVLEETRQDLEIAGRPDLIAALSQVEEDFAPPPAAPISNLPDVLKIEGRSQGKNSYGQPAECHTVLTFNFAQKKISGLISGFVTQPHNVNYGLPPRFAIGGPIKGIAYVGTKEKGSFKGKVEVFYRTRMRDGTPLDGSMIYPLSGSLEGRMIKLDVSECGHFEIAIP